MWITQPAAEEMHSESICVECIALYESESWTLLKRDVERLEAFEMWIWRHMMRISWTEQKTNDEMLEAVGTQRELVDTVRARQQVVGTCTATRLAVEDSIGRKSTGEETQQEAEANVFGLVIEERQGAY